jgi:hypothetical protein
MGLRRLFKAIGNTVTLDALRYHCKHDVIPYRIVLHEITKFNDIFVVPGEKERIPLFRGKH